MAAPHLEKNRIPTLHRFVLEQGHNRAGFYRLAGEQIAGTQQHANSDSDRRCRGCQGGYHGGRAAIVNPSGEDNVDRLFVAALALKLQQGFDYGFPQDKTGKWPHMPAALPAFEYKSAPALAKEHLE